MKDLDLRRIVVLIGMPGAGKSTVGALLARRLGRACIDTDRLIEEDGKASLSVLLDRHGIDGFRMLEAAALLRALEMADAAGGAVISTGGSAVYCAAEMQLLRDAAWIVYLEVDLPTLVARAGDLYARGVVRRPGQSLAELFDERALLYARYAHRRYVCGDLPASAVCEQIVAAAG